MAQTVRRIAEELRRLKGVTVILGAVDSGKTTLARRLAAALLKRGTTVSLVDSDLGQSSLGLPGTISVKTFRDSGEMKDPKPDAMFFIGSLSPAGTIRQVVGGAKRMAEKTRGEVVLVDTSGLVSGRAGRNLKLEKVRALRPIHIIALQRAHELEHILSHMEGIRIHRLTVSPKARRRSRAERTAYRKEKFRVYFKDAGVLTLSLTDVKFLRAGVEYDAGGKPLDAGSYVGLNQGEDTIAVGLLEKSDTDAVLVRTPLRSAGGIDRVCLGERLPELRRHSKGYAHPVEQVREF